MQALPVALSPRSLTPSQASEVARRALATQDEAAVIAPIASLAQRTATDARLWQWTGLLHRALDDRASALKAFEQAACLAPGDAGIAHGRARIAYEAGRPAVALYARALTLAPQDGDILLGRTAARLAAGEGDAALSELGGIVAQVPRWVAGQAQFARLRWMLGDRDGFAQGFAFGTAVAPRDMALWREWIAVLQHADAWPAVLDVVRSARRQIGEHGFLTLAEAEAWSMTHDSAADAAFDRLADDPASDVAIRRIRHLLSRGRIEAARPAIERGFAGADTPDYAPYAALVWRLSGDARADWLDAQAGLVSIRDLTGALPPLDRLAAKLRALHQARHQHLDQSVRGGTQTDGILLANIDPDIQATRRAIGSAIERHIEAMPPIDPRHPTLANRRDRAPRFAGSWSVRLRGGGRHENHVHPAGWISSALYVSLPEPDGQSGWLTLGAPQEALGLDLPPRDVVEPKPGRLVLFPSTMWHGTNPTLAGERLTIAFDVARPVAET